MPVKAEIKIANRMLLVLVLPPWPTADGRILRSSQGPLLFFLIRMLLHEDTHIIQCGSKPQRRAYRDEGYLDGNE
jgi:hypothetical protein